MITVSQIRGGGNYLTHHLRSNDYYSEGEQVEGVWQGRAADMLGLKGELVTPESFESLRENRHPETGERLRERAAQVRFHDFVVSSPKTVSIAAMVGKDERLLEAFDRCALNAFERLEGYASVRLRGGQNYHSENLRQTGNGIAAVFRHDTSRLLEPQVHTHLVFGNLSWDAESGRWLALQPKVMAEQSKEWIRGGFYRDLEGECRKLGYGTEKAGEAFRLKGISPEIEMKFQQRTSERKQFEERYREMFAREPSKSRIEEFIKDQKSTARRRFKDEYQSEFRRWPSKETVETFVVDWRSSKMAKSERGLVHAGQRNRLSDEERRQLDRLVSDTRKQCEIPQQEKMEEVQQFKEGSSSKQTNGEAMKPPLPKEKRQRREKQLEKKKQFERAIGQREAMRRMKRGMALARALQGHPASLMLRQLTELARQRQ